MKQLASSLLVSTGLLVLPFAIAGNTGHAFGAPNASNTAQLSATVAVDDLVMLQRRFTSGRGPCTGELGVPTNRVFPDGTQELFVVPAGKALVLTDLEGEITKNLNAAWFVGSIGVLTATLTGAVANQTVRARAQIDGDALSASIVTIKLHLESGAVADSGAAVCLSAIVVEKMGFRSANLGTDVRVYGYLIER